ncbi:MAG: tetratricopeptide repeat protein [Kofleriaceae bacterium]
MAHNESWVEESFGKTYYEAGRYLDAIPAFERAYELHPRPVLLLHLANAHEQAGNPIKAIEYYRRYILLADQGENGPRPDCTRASCRRYGHVHSDSSPRAVLLAGRSFSTDLIDPAQLRDVDVVATRTARSFSTDLIDPAELRDVALTVTPGSRSFSTNLIRPDD